ncbi:hypothetical protein SDC9_192517 [bioreactor metagenome]|uniref:Uncharacterized protein n=1 Tax=bioreactor metagenome TaxID=1076179 RepID=A0A645I1C3_9ZZZZ
MNTQFAVDPDMADLFAPRNICEVGNRVETGLHQRVNKADCAEVSLFADGDRADLCVETERACAPERGHVKGSMSGHRGSVPSRCFGQ